MQDYKSAEFIESDDSDKVNSIESKNDNKNKSKNFEEEEERKMFDSIPYAAISKAPRQFSSQFKVTIFPKRYKIELEREHFYNELTTYFKNIELIVSKEDDQSNSKFRSKSIIKIYIDFSGTPEKGMKTPNLYTLIETFFRKVVGTVPLSFNESEMSSADDIDKRPEIIIEKVKNKKNSIVWATLDHSPRYTANFDPVTEFSESNRLFNWAKKNINNKFSLNDPFVQRSRFSAARLKQYQDEFNSTYHVPFKLKPVEIGPFNDWRDEVIKWFNDWINEGWYHKRLQLLLVSKPNCGKTVFIRDVLFRQGRSDAVPSEAILIPERKTPFAWQKANPAYQAVVFCDEFEPKHYNTELLKIILQGDAFTPNKKHIISGDDICLRIPMIFVSNNIIPDSYTGLKERFNVVLIADSVQAYTPTMKSPYQKLFNEQETKNISYY